MFKKEKTKNKHKRIRAKISGTSKRPRLHVFRSLRHIYVQVIDDSKGKTLLSASDHNVNTKEKGKTSVAFALGKKIAEEAKEKKIKEVVFDRGGNIYHGRIKAVADGARDGGLKF